MDAAQLRDHQIGACVALSMEQHNARDPEKLTDTEIRSGVKLGTMRYVLVWGLVAAVVVLILGYFLYR